MLLAAGDGDVEEVRRCAEGHDRDRGGLFDRDNPRPDVVVARPRGSHGRFNSKTPLLLRGSLGDTALHKAAEHGKEEAVEYIISAASSGSSLIEVPGLTSDIEGAGGTMGRILNAPNSMGATPLHLACARGHWKCVELLLQGKADVNAQDRDKGFTPLHCCARDGALETFRVLLEHKADPNIPDLTGSTCLHISARFGQHQLLDPLAAAGCVLDRQRPSDGYTALHVACRYSDSMETVRTLLRGRADPTLKSRSGQPAAFLALKFCSREIFSMISEHTHRSCILNPDKAGLTRIKEGGNLTVRAAFDVCMHRLVRAMSQSGHGGLWYNPSHTLLFHFQDPVEEIEMEVEEGVPCGNWVASGPLDPEKIESEIAAQTEDALLLLQDKVGLFTSQEDMERLVQEEMEFPSSCIRQANQQWWGGRNSCLEFDFLESSRCFQQAGALMQDFWWGEEAAAMAEGLSKQMREFHELRVRLDEKMARGGELIRKFEFKEAMQELEGVSGLYATLGHARSCFLSIARLREATEKRKSQQEARRALQDARSYIFQRCDMEDYPFSRLMLKEAAERFQSSQSLFSSFGDAESAESCRMQLAAVSLKLEKQEKAHEALKEGVELRKERIRAAVDGYTPSPTYKLGTCIMIRNHKGAAEKFGFASQLMADIGDETIQRMAIDLRQHGEKFGRTAEEAAKLLLEGMKRKDEYVCETSMQGKIIVFGEKGRGRGGGGEGEGGGAGGEGGGGGGRSFPYLRHSIDEDYPLEDTGGRKKLHRLMFKESMETLRASKLLFCEVDDEENATEAEEREGWAQTCMDTQSRAFELLLEGQEKILARRYGDAQHAYEQAAKLMGEVEDEINGKYARMLCDDAVSKRKLAEEGHVKFRRGLETLGKKEAFSRWEDVANEGPSCFQAAESLFEEAEKAFEILGDAELRKKAKEYKEEAYERKLHAEEVRECVALVVQPTGEFAPRRSDRRRRTMPYKSGEQAIRDAATTGKSSTEHAASEIEEGSVVVLKRGEHRCSDTIQWGRDVSLQSEEAVTAESCVLVIENQSLLEVVARNVRIEQVTLRQLLGDGAEDYWSGGIYVLRTRRGAVEMRECVVHSQRGSGVIAAGAGKVLLLSCSIVECGQYGVGADGEEAIVELRDCSISLSKFDDVDERNGGRVVGFVDPA